MRQLLDLARENATLKRELARIRAELARIRTEMEAEDRLAGIRDAQGDRTCSSLPSEPCDLTGGICARWNEREST